MPALDLVPVSSWHNIFNRMLSESRVELRNIDLAYNPGSLPAIAVSNEAVRTLTEDEADDRTLLFEALIDIIARLMLILARDLAPANTEPLPVEQQTVLERLAFRLSGAIEAVVFVRRMGSGYFSVRVLTLEQTPHAALPYRMCMAERRDVNFVLTLLYSDTGRARDFMRFTPAQLFFEALYRHVRGEANIGRALRWGETALIGTLLEAITIGRTVAHDISTFDFAIAPVVRAVLLGSNVSAFLSRVAQMAGVIADELQRARNDDESAAVIGRLRSTVNQMTNRAGLPRNLPRGMTREQLYQLLTNVAVGFHRVGLAERPLLRSRYGNDPVDYSRIVYVPNPGEDDEEYDSNSDVLDGVNGHNENGATDTSSSSTGAKLAPPYTEICIDGSRLTHL